MDIRYAAIPDTCSNECIDGSRADFFHEWQEPNLVLLLGTSHMSSQSREDARRLIQVLVCGISIHNAATLTKPLLKAVWVGGAA